MRGTPRRRNRLSVCGVVIAAVVALTGSAPPTTTDGPATTSSRTTVTTPRMDCAALAKRTVEVLPGEPATIDLARVAPATADTPERCEVTALIAPQHQFTLKLPTKTWTGRYLQFGCGGLCGLTEPHGQTQMAEQCPGYQDGEYAVASGNGGHVGSNGSFALDPNLVEDYAYEAEHQLSVASKNIIELYYGTPPDHSYFTGCSGGGRQALNLAQRYPTDFDGIIAGAPAANWVAMFVFSAGWSARANLAADGTQILTSEDLPVLHKGALAACDRLDGLTDGLITDPRACSFDPGTLRCEKGRTTGCLTAAEVTAARKIYRGAVDERGVPFYPGHPGGGQPIGSEPAWQSYIVRDHPDVPSGDEQLADTHLRYLAAPNQAKSYDWRTISFDRKTFRELSTMSPVMNANDPDLRPFRDAGGKLILWHGWNDAPIPAQGTIAYWEAVRKVTGAGTDRFARLYLIPGMYHCEGGDGPDRADMLTPLTEWVEGGGAPDRVVVSERDEAGTTVRTRPVYPYPRVAVHDGVGDPDKAASFTSGPGRNHPPARWVDTFRSGAQQWCEVRDGKLVCTPHRGDN
ncbi:MULTISPECIES: tannase/feruloyl esterase family alpha/beta hydrolase [unclassified Streptomyces]|uniref:tannase/feruloyl esterase family alpha/beta hydrolase n=1 Tax=unclassified Streptomyces TaxID=2593676 RepID=UPI003804D160